VLAEHASEHFQGRYNNYMQFTARCRNPGLYPAITHVDGTSRVQTVEADGSGIRRLLERWYEETGCPMLLNTSLNIKGKPMVNDLTDAQEFAIMYNVKVVS
jgi:carbamoyltransferase